jgi:HD-like signal output (HDOD) protein
MAASHQIVNLGRASAIQTLRPFPAVACHLMTLVNGGTNVHFGEVSRVLMADAAFSSQVLRVANSALLGVRYEVKSILQACRGCRWVTRFGGYGSPERICGPRRRPLSGSLLAS